MKLLVLIPEKIIHRSKNISGKIIRVRYKATDEQDKIFNKAIIEKSCMIRSILGTGNCS